MSGYRVLYQAMGDAYAPEVIARAIQAEIRSRDICVSAYTEGGVIAVTGSLQISVGGGRISVRDTETSCWFRLTDYGVIFWARLLRCNVLMSDGTVWPWAEAEDDPGTGEWGDFQ